MVEKIFVKQKLKLFEETCPGCFFDLECLI